MTDDQQQLFDNYSEGNLSEAESEAFLHQVETDASMKEAWENYRLSRQVLQADNEATIRDMLRGIDANSDSVSSGNYNKWWILASIIAALIVIFGVAMVQFDNLEPVQVADQYLISDHQPIQRSSTALPTDSLLMANYYLPLQIANDHIDHERYDDARKALEQITLEAEVIQQNKEWMLALVSYMQNGRSDQYFQDVLSKILDDATHNNYPQAVKLNDKVNNFWGRLRG